MTDADDKLLHQRAMGLRVLTLALIVGVIMITGVFMVIFFVAFEGKPLLGPGLAPVPILSLIAVATALVALGLSIVLPSRIGPARAEKLASGVPLRGNPTESAVSRLAGAYAGRLILGLALAEGPALLGVVFFLVEGHWLALLPVGLGVLVMIWKFPTEAALREWVEARLAEIPDQKSKPVHP